MFTRLARGDRPDADSLCSLLMWLNPRASLSEYTVVGDGRTTRRRRAAIGPATS
jgi:hypothetical protein